MKRKTLSVVLAVFNEEKKLGACLDSVKGIADEIIIVDGTSTDRTVEIAKQYGAKIKETTNKPNFHINKQIAIDMATKDWVLQLDADEHISKESKEEIRRILEKDAKECNGYWMPRKNWFLGKFLMKGGQYPDYTLRLYRNGKGKLPQKDVHEQAVVEGEVGYLKEALLHYPYESLSFYLKKWNKYNDFFASQIKDELSKKNVLQKFIYGVGYLFIKPAHWFLTTFFRHKGFVDSWQGFIFSFFSALRFPASYLKTFSSFQISVFLILLLAFIIRFYNFPNRWGLGGDDARDAMIALEALQRHEIPLIGSFSSAGPFVFGPTFYWTIMLSYVIFPFTLSAPWILTGIIGVATVLIITYCAKLIGGEKLAIIAGILAALSPQLVIRSLMLGQHSYISFFTSFLILSFLLLWQRKKMKYAFLMGLFLGLALSFHYQAMNLFLFFPALFLIKGLNFKEKTMSLILMLIGFTIPSLPLLYWDLHQQFANIRNILEYFLVIQYTFYVPNSWKLFMFNFFPNYWAFVVGRFQFVAFSLFTLSGLFFLIAIVKRKIKGELLVLGGIFFLLVLVNRFYNGERSEGYLLYFLPFIIILSAWVIDILLFNNLFKFKNIIKKISITLGIVIFLIIMVGDSITIYKSESSTSAVKNYKKLSKFLTEKYPGKKFAIYDYKYELYGISTGVSFVLRSQNLTDKNGLPLGIGCYTTAIRKCPTNLKVIKNIQEMPVYDMSNNGNLLKNKKQWINVSPQLVYDDLIGWSKKNELKSNFNLEKYIINRLGNKQ